MFESFAKWTSTFGEVESAVAEAAQDVETTAQMSLQSSLPSTGFKRDRTAQFRRMRYASRKPSAGRTSSSAFGGSVAGTVASQLQEIFEKASTAHTSLASKLAQHNGLRQFSVDFAERVPPLEWRMMLPELETSIQEQLRALQSYVADLQLLEVAPASPNCRLCRALEDYITSIVEQRRTTFEEQRAHLRTLSANSPLHSPVLCPALNQRLVARRSSSPSTTAPPRSPSFTGALAPGCMDLLLLPAALSPAEWDDDNHGGLAPTVDIEMVIDKLSFFADLTSRTPGYPR